MYYQGHIMQYWPLLYGTETHKEYTSVSPNIDLFTKWKKNLLQQIVNKTINTIGHIQFLLQLNQIRPEKQPHFKHAAPSGFLRIFALANCASPF